MALLNILRAPLFRNFANCVPLVNSACPLLTNAVASVVSKMNFTTTNALGNIRNHFPRPSEYKRVKNHGWKKRMSTLSGRKVLMNRILKGRFVLSH